jgi:chromosome partitioning protein
MTIISCLNHKGGVGKTTTVLNLSAALSKMGYSCLVVDMDGQANTTRAIVGKVAVTPSVFHALTDAKTPLPVLEVSEKLALCPASSEMAQLDLALSTAMNREYLLKRKLAKLATPFDFVWIDCPPSQGLASVNALTASDFVLVPLQGEVFAFDGLETVNRTIAMVQENSNEDLQLLGVFLTMLNPRRELTKTVRRGAAAIYGGKLMETEIRIDVRLAEAPTAMQAIFDYAPDCNGAKDYQRLTEEILKRIQSNG